MLSSRKPEPAADVFFEGDEVVLAQGTYTGTRGIFLRSTADAKWVQIRERNGSVRSHPLEWLAHVENEQEKSSIPIPDARVNDARVSE